MAAAKSISTDRQIAALKPLDKVFEVSIDGARGLALRVFPTGTKTFEFRYVSLVGKRRRLPLGSYPGLKLAEAREKAGGLRVIVVDGGDPAEERIAARVAARTGETLAELAEAYWAAAARGLHGGRGRPKAANTLTIEEGRWRKHIAPHLGASRFTELRRSDIKGFMRGLAVKGELSPDTISSVGGTLSSILSFAVHEERIDVNPAIGVTRPLALQTRDRMFDDDALTKIWKSLVLASAPRVKGKARADMSARLEPATALALRFALLTLCRRGEVAGARWAEIDEKARTWTIPPERAKSRRPHVVPLTEASLAIVREARALTSDPKPTFLFPAPERPDTQLDAHVLTRALARICERQKVAHGTPHDFRRSGATTLTSEAYGVRRFVVSKVLAHAANDGGAAVTGVYDRNDYLPDKRVALEIWSEHIIALAEGRPVRSGKVVAMRRRRA